MKGVGERFNPDRNKSDGNVESRIGALVFQCGHFKRHRAVIQTFGRSCCFHGDCHTTDALTVPEECIEAHNDMAETPKNKGNGGGCSVVEPTKADVLLGKGGRKYNRQHGNIHFRGTRVFVLE
jgi:hypothetical protein